MCNVRNTASVLDNKPSTNMVSAIVSLKYNIWTCLAKRLIAKQKTMEKMKL